MRVVLLLCASFFSLTAISEASEFTALSTSGHVSISSLNEDSHEALSSLEEGRYFSSDGSFGGLTISQWGDEYYVEAYVYYGQFAHNVVYTVTQGSSNLYEGIAVPNFLRYLRGTPWLPMALNLLGSHIGKGVYLDTTDITEFDCVRVGDYCVLNSLCALQTHLYEDRVMKVGRVYLGDGVTVGAAATVLYDTNIGDFAQLGPLTVVMKGESIPGNSAWIGAPAEPFVHVSHDDHAREPVKAAA